jgi:hypothetical protein
MRFRNRSGILAAAIACLASVGNAFGQSSREIVLEPPHEPQGRKHHSKPRKPTRRQRIKASLRRKKRELGGKVTLNRMIWTRCVKQGLQFKLFLEACQQGKHGDWKNDGRLAQRQPAQKWKKPLRA